MRKIRPASVFENDDFPLVVVRHDTHGNAELHKHGFHELVIILSGKGRHITDEDEYPLTAGDVFLIRGDMAHGYDDTERYRMKLVNILFAPRRLGLPLHYLQDLPGYHILFRVEPRLRNYHDFRHHLHLSEVELAKAAEIIAHLQKKLEEKEPGYRFQSLTCLMELIGLFSVSYSNPHPESDRALLRMGEVLSFIEQHFTEPITIKQLTRMAHMSESTLMRVFQRVLGRSPIEHVIRVRVLRAAELLQHEDIRITEAAMECGFSDSNYFSRQFRQIMGITPREYHRHYHPLRTRHHA